MNDLNTLGPIIVRFSQEEVRAGDLTRFLCLYAPERFGRGPALQSLLGSLHLAFDSDYTSHEGAEGYVVPATRAFCQKLRAAFPFLGYHASLESPFYRGIGLACLADLSVLKGKSGPVKVFYTIAQMEAFVAGEEAGMREFAARAELARTAVEARAAALRRYFLLEGGKTRA